MTVGVGVVGSGFMGRTWAEVATRHIPRTTVVGVAGGHRAARLAADYGCALESSVEGLLENPDVAIAIIASPPAVHERQVVAAAMAGKHVLVEKPMAQNRLECDRMLAACRRYGTKLAVVSQHRFRDAPLACKRLIDDGAIGNVTMVRATGVETGWWDTAARGDSWKLDPSQQTAYASWGAHACDLLRWLMGSRPTLAFARFETYSAQPPPGQSAMATYLFESGAMAQVWMTYEFPRPRLGSPLQFLIVGRSGTIDLDCYGAVRLGRDDGWTLACEQPAFDPTDPNDPTRLRAYADQLTDLLAAIDDDRQPLVSGEEGQATVQMIEAAERSGLDGQAVELPLAPSVGVGDA